MTETGCKNLYGTCSFSVTTLVGAILAGTLAVAPASAQTSNTFTEFQTRCLTPMLEVRESDTTGLIRVSNEGAVEVWRAATEPWELRRAASGDSPQFCAIAGVGLGFEPYVWADAVVTRGEFVDVSDITDPNAPMIFQSTTLREPRIEVEIEMLSNGGCPCLTVIETNLES